MPWALIKKFIETTKQWLGLRRREIKDYIEIKGYLLPAIF